MNKYYLYTQKRKKAVPTAWTERQRGNIICITNKNDLNTLSHLHFDVWIYGWRPFTVFIIANNSLPTIYYLLLLLLLLPPLLWRCLSLISFAFGLLVAIPSHPIQFAPKRFSARTLCWRWWWLVLLPLLLQCRCFGIRTLFRCKPFSINFHRATRSPYILPS